MAFSFAPLLRTPQRARTLCFLALGMWCTLPVYTVHYFFIGLAHGYYSPEADSIRIPIFKEWLLIAACTPFFITLLYFTLRRYPGSVSLAQPLAGKTLQKLMISTFFAPGVFCTGEELIVTILDWMPWMVFYPLAWFIVWVMLWAVAFAKLESMRAAVKTQA